ncbi:hypothetical protein KBZ33_11870 [Cyanobium sp. Cruz-8D1]|nr:MULTISPECIES: hypothetical protein [unclassified Cyanobium]MCP9859921.1 hypothetical protein [Cyanobium sp. Cruz-8H5]MCP9866981.1 hypothetical protein [Cyanobium sp. Cruz-8D1]
MQPALGGEQAGLLDVFQPFGHPHQRLGQPQTLGVPGTHGAGEGAIQLQPGDRPIAQMADRRVAGAEIIHVPTDPTGGQRLNLLADA